MAIPSLAQPPSKPHETYTIPAYSGEVYTIPTSNSVMRLLVTGKETDGAFAVVTTGGTSAAPIGFHYHREAHDVFLCLKGEINVWAGDRCRTLAGGDFASVPPGTIHQYQILSRHTEFAGLIIPGGWEEFFRFIGEPYSGPMFPTADNRNPMEVLVPKLIAATEKFDVVFARDHKQVDPQPWTDEDAGLPEKMEPYFLKCNQGPTYAVGGLLVRPLVGTKQSDGKFSIARIEGSSAFQSMGIFTQFKSLKFGQSHHCFLVDDGVWKFTVGYSSQLVAQGESIFVPSGASFKMEAATKFAACYCFANGGGLSEALVGVGSKHEGPVLEKEQSWEFEKGRWDEVETRSKVIGLQRENLLGSIS